MKSFLVSFRSPVCRFLLKHCQYTQRNCQTRLFSTLRIQPNVQQKEREPIQQEGKFELSYVVQKAKFCKIRLILAGLKSYMISYEDYLKLCAEVGINEAEARELSQSYHNAGIFLHFHEDDDLKHQMYLQPKEFIEFVYGNYGIQSPVGDDVDQQIERLEEQKKEIDHKMQPITQLMERVEKDSRHVIGNYMWGIAGGVGSGYVFYWYLTYQELSWDIMEPITFFTTLATSIVGYSWWMFSKSEYEFENIQKHFFHKNFQKRTRNIKISVDQLNEFKKQREVIEEKILNLQQYKSHLELLHISSPLDLSFESKQNSTH